MLVTKLIMQAHLEDGSVIEVMTPEDASKEFKKCLKTIYNWIYGEKVQTVKGNKQVLIVKDSLLSFLSSKKRNNVNSSNCKLFTNSSSIR